MAQSYGGYGQQSQQQPSGNMNYAASGTAPQQHSYGGYDTTTGYTGYQQSTQQSTGFQTANYQQPQQGPQTGGYSQGGYNQTQTGYNQNQGNYNQGNYNQAQGSYNQNQGGYNQGQSGYNQNQHGYGQGSQNNYNQSGGGSGGYSKSEGVGSYGNGGKGSDRGGYGGDRGGPRSGAGHFGNNVVKDGMLIQEDTIFVSGLPTSASTKEIAEFFGQIGVIKMDKRTHQPKIWIYKRPDGSSKGECTVTYEDTEASSAAVNWFNGKTFGSETIKVSIAERKAPAGGFGKKRGGGRGGGRDFGGGRGGGFGGGRGRGGGGDSRDGDWTCPKCNNNNFARRSECNRCGEQRSGNSGGGRDRGSRDSGRDRDRDRSDRRSRPY